MPLYSCEGIVLRADRIEESDRMVHFFTDQFGRIKVRVKGITRTGSRLGSIAEPLSHDLLSLYKPREDKPVFSLTQAHLIHAHEVLRNDLTKYYAASFVVELIDRCTEDGDPHFDLWLLLMETLQLLEYADSPTGLLLAFQLRAFRTFGVGLNLEQCTSCGKKLSKEKICFSATLGGFLGGDCCREDASALPVSPELQRALFAASTRPMEKAALWDCPPEIWLDAIRILKPFWEHHLDFDPKSLKFIQVEEL